MFCVIPPKKTPKTLSLIQEFSALPPFKPSALTLSACKWLLCIGNEHWPKACRKSRPGRCCCCGGQKVSILPSTAISGSFSGRVTNRMGFIKKVFSTLPSPDWASTIPKGLKNARAHTHTHSHLNTLYTLKVWIQCNHKLNPNGLVLQVRRLQSNNVLCWQCEI